jgi:ATP sulfurylase
VQPKVYVETTIISYLVARRTRNLIVGAHQELTRRWWRQRRRFEIFVSPLVLEEASRGDMAARLRRVRLLRDLALLEVNDDSRAVGR